MPRKSSALAFVCCVATAAFLHSSAGHAADRSSDHQQGLRSNPPAVWALTNARVFVSPETELTGATLVIRGGKIDSIGTGETIPADAVIIDLSGKTVYAGLIDACSEQSISTEGLSKTARYWNNNVTPQVTVAGQVEDAGPVADSLRKQGVVARLIAPADGVIRGRSALLSLGTASINDQLLASDVAQHMQLTVSRRSRGIYPGSPMGAVALARQALYDAQWYRDAWNAVGAEAGLPLPERNDALAALLPVVNGTMPVIIETSNEMFFQRAELFAAEFGLNLIVHGSGREYRRLAEIVATGRPVILPVNFPAAPNVSTPEAAEEATLESLMHWDIAPENPARLDAAGVRIAFSTKGLASTGDFLKSLRKAVDRGLSPETALRALTVTPAELFGVSDQLGTLQKGRLASLVITDGDLFSEKTKIVETWVAGERFRHQPDPARSAEGQFELRITSPLQQPDAQRPDKLFAKISRDGSRLSGKISRAPITEPTKKSGKSASDQATDQPETSDSDAAKPADEPTNVAKKETDSKDADAGEKVLSLTDVTQVDTAISGRFNGRDWGLEGVIRISMVLSEPNSPMDAADDNGENVSDSAKPLGFATIVWPDGRSESAGIYRMQPAADVATATDAKTGAADGSAAETAVAKEASEEAAGKQAEKSGEKPGEKPSKKSAKASFAVNYPFGAFGREQLPPQPKLTAFLHATLWTCGPQGVIEDATLLIGEGRIIAAGRDVEIPEGAELIDVSGMHISPGLIDCHSHAATDGGVNESTQAITCEVRIGDFIDSDDITIYRQLAGGVTTANILHGSANPIGGQNQVIKLRWGMNGQQLKFAEAPPGVKFALGENVKQSNWGSEATGRYPQTRLGVEQIYRDAFQAARDYAARMDAWTTNRRGLPPRRDLELDALREIIERRRWIHCHSYRQDEILALIRILDEYKITIGTFQHILEGYKVADAMAQHGAMASAFSDWWAYKVEVQDAIPYAGALMHNAGVVVSYNSDDGELARHLNQEAAKAIKYGGVSREEALKFVTLNPAKQLRIDQYTGSLEAGKHADFVVWNGDPLSNFSRCEQTWIDGRAFFHRNEDEELQQAAFEMRNTLIQKILTSGEKTRDAGERDADPTAMWPRYDEFCRHLDKVEQVRLLEQETLDAGN